MMVPVKFVLAGRLCHWLGCWMAYCMMKTVPKRKNMDEAIANALTTRISVKRFVTRMGVKAIDAIMTIFV